MTRIVLVRHGHVEGISPERFRGRAELPLTERGVREARATARYLARRWQPKVVYTSPLGRCVATGREIATACTVPSIVLPALTDIDYGQWQWKTHTEVQQHWAEEYRLWQRSPQLIRFPSGESLQDLAARTAEALRHVLAQHRDDTVVLVGHESSNRALLLQVLALPLSAFWSLNYEPCAVSEALIDPESSTVVRVNETAHLLDIDHEVTA